MWGQQRYQIAAFQSSSQIHYLSMMTTRLRSLYRLHKTPSYTKKHYSRYRHIKIRYLKTMENLLPVRSPSLICSGTYLVHKTKTVRIYTSLSVSTNRKFPTNMFLQNLDLLRVTSFSAETLHIGIANNYNYNKL